jgi:predicted enzyme related to lactoylglutathione lyase
MPAPLTGTRPAQIKIAVDDVATSRAFYQDAFGMRYDVIRRTEDEDYSSFMFGEYGQDGFFPLVLVDDADRLDRPGPSTFGLLVDDLATTHARALAAGGTELVAPRDAQGMPRNSAVKDPSGKERATNTSLSELPGRSAYWSALARSLRLLCRAWRSSPLGAFASKGRLAAVSRVRADCRCLFHPVIDPQPERHTPCSSARSTSLTSPA